MILNSHRTSSQPPPPPATKNTKVILWLGLVVLFQTSSVISSIDCEIRATYEQDLLPKSLTEIFIRINRDLLDQEEFGINCGLTLTLSCMPRSYAMKSSKCKGTNL